MSNEPRPRLFVYYRVAATQRAACVAAVRALQAALQQQHPGLTAALLQRPPAPSQASVTLMETYTCEPHGIDADLQACIESAARAAVQPWIEGPRHPEVFVECV